MAAPIVLFIKANSDDVFLYWDLPDQHRFDGCLGFAIKRKMVHDGETTTDWLKNRVGFADQPAVEGETRPSTDWPFQRYNWTDHDVGQGDSVQYRIYPVIQDAAGHLTQDESRASEWGATIAIDEPKSGKASYYFNRGVPASQFVARYVRAHHLTATQFKDQVADHASPIRMFMGGYLLDEIKALVSSVAGKTHLPSRAEHAAHRASGLRRNTGGAPPVVIFHQHAFDQLAVRQAKQPFDGLPVERQPFADLLHYANACFGE